jgi:hypothetical protein
VHVALALRSRAEARSHKTEAAHGEVAIGGSDLPVATLAEVMRSFKGYTGLELGRLLELSGPVWQDAYHDEVLRERRDFDARLEYMHDNPRRRGLAEKAEDYPFSTAHPTYAQEIDWEWIEGWRDEF